MFEYQTIVVFVLASTALALAPGPDNIFVLTQSALHGRVAGWWVTIGLATGLLFHSALAAFGVAAILAASPVAFTALKVVGVGYLLYLAWGAYRAGPISVDGQTLPPTGRTMYARGVIMNVTNPKVAIFFLAFLPQFATQSERTEAVSAAAQMLVLGGLFIIVTLVVFGGIAWAAGFIGDWLKRSPRGQVVINRLAALVFVALAVRLLVSARF